LKQGRFAVVGGGAWGTALAVDLAREGAAVRLWMRDATLVARMRVQRDNPAHLPGIRVPDGVLPLADLVPALDGAETVVVAVPAQYARAVYRAMRPHFPPGAPVIVTCKGIEEGTLALPLDVAAAELAPPDRLGYLSGPSFALEVAQGLPTAVVMAAQDALLAGRLQERVASRSLRVYTNQDPLGVQLAAALKNVMAIAAGVADSLGLGSNAVAALITRGLAEITRLVLARGGGAGTTAGLAGMGDLVLTCTGEQSRNRRVGQRIGRGERLEDVLAGDRSVAEGVRTVRAARELAGRAGVEMPIVDEVYRILYEEGRVHEGLERLLGRRLTAEEEALRARGG